MQGVPHTSSRATGTGQTRRSPFAEKKVCAKIARLAVRSLYMELALYPKPGLVSLVDNGSHADMNAETFLRSLFSLRGYFARICQAGMEGAPFHVLKRLGIVAEARMLRATGGINTHRGAIFSLGLLCASFGQAWSQGKAITPDHLRLTLMESWGPALTMHTISADNQSHGAQAARQHGASGAREEAALGLPSVFELALPAMQRTLVQGRSMYHARIDALFVLMNGMSDTNIYHRGGAEGAHTVRRHAARFIELGGTAHAAWRELALACHNTFVAHRLSPGGAADLLAAACLVLAMTDGPCII